MNGKVESGQSPSNSNKSSTRVDTPKLFNIINSDLLRGQPLARSDAASPDVAPDADSDIDALVEETLA